MNRRKAKTLSGISIVIAGLTLVSGLSGQSAGPASQFELADVHVSPHSDNPSLRVFLRDGRYELLGATMLDLISTAWGVKPETVIGGPGWLESDRFDVIAKTPVDAPPDALRGKLQSLLADRFGLVVHRGTVERPAYLLTAGARLHLKQSGGPGGGACAVSLPPGSPALNINLSCQNVTMGAFAQAVQANSSGAIGGYLGHTEVADTTGLEGGWDIDLKWTGRGRLESAGGDALTLFDALDKQLGLKLAMGKAPLPALIVDKVNEQPTANLPGVSDKLPPLRLTFDVVVIKPSTQDHPTAPKFMPGGRMDVRGVTLIAIIQHAWGLDTYDNELIVGGPKWLTTDRFDILTTATPPQGAASSLKDDDSLRTMLQNMLADRFKLAVHTEEKQVSVLALTADKPRLKDADPSSRSRCTESGAPLDTHSGVPMRMISCTNTTAAQFVERLHGLAPGYIRQPVVDLTGLSGGYDFSVLYSRPGAIRAAITRGDGQSALADPDGAVTLFEVLEKQLGLKLATEKRAWPVLVIDHVDAPTDN